MEINFMNNLLKLILIVICLSSCNQSLEKRAENGDPQAQYELAMYYIDSLPRNTMDVSRQAEGVHLLRLASNQNHSAAQFEFARCYMSGLIVDRDTDEAIKWFVKSAQSGYVDAQLILGRVYSSGEDVEQDYEQSFYWYDMARKAGDVRGAVFVSLAYINAMGVKQDYKSAFDALYPFALRGDPDALFYIGYYYAKGIGVEQDYEQREKLYIKAAEAGHIAAMSELGSIYYYGEEGGVEKDIQK